jgi:hypothetical protein
VIYADTPRKSAFIELIGCLQSTHQDHILIAIIIQEALSRASNTKNYDLGSGNTAIPSIHVSVVVFFFLSMRRMSSRLGWIIGIFALIIMLDSVHLTFLHAVDSYVPTRVKQAELGASPALTQAALKPVPRAVGVPF